MPDFTPHQKRIIERYYDHRDEIALTRLQEMVSELYLADTQRKTDLLWKRVDKAMKSLKVPPGVAQHILTRRDPEALARSVRDWLSQSRKASK